MRATPDLPDEMTPAFFLKTAKLTRWKAARIFPRNAMDCYSIASLNAMADTYERIAEAEWTFDGLMSELIRRQAQLAELYGVKP